MKTKYCFEISHPIKFQWSARDKVTHCRIQSCRYFLCVSLSLQRIDNIVAISTQFHSISIGSFQEPFTKGFSLFSIDFSFKTTTKITLLVSRPGFHNLRVGGFKTVILFAIDRFTRPLPRFIKGQINKLTHNCGSLTTKENLDAFKTALRTVENRLSHC